ncbi:MAG: DeoR family transcriptional regulator [Cetobacterium sp.]|uniref:DeoR family transcriptional regulator n=1 Tax=Cetobacterium sp. TaxID=2071632 RepID=UPI003EE671DC
MNTRQQKILAYLYKRENLQIKLLSEEFTLGERTIRNDLKIINNYLGKKDILIIKKGMININIALSLK